MSATSAWSRYGAQYRRLCARAGCGAPAVATLRFQSTQRTAWLVELDDSTARTQGDLCQRHAAGLVLPRGWDLHDERSAAAARVAPVNGNGSNGNGSNGNGSNGNGARRVRVKRKEGQAELRTVAGRLPGLEHAPAESNGLAEPPEVRHDAEPVTDDATVIDDATVDGARSALVPSAGEGEDVEEALDAILDARTPLLQRAFRNARPQ